MRELIRHILRESDAKSDILNLIKDEDIFVAAKFVGGLDNLKQILKNEPEYVTLIDSLKGKLNLIYHSLKEYLEFPMKFEIVGKGENVFKNNSWPIVNLIYDDSNLSYGEKKMFEQFIYDTIGDLNIDIVDIKPEAKKMFREKGGYMAIDYVNGKHLETLDHDIQPEDKDMRNLHREYYTKSYMNESKTLQENEEDPTQKVLNLLLRRYKLEEKKFGDDENPIKFKVLKIYIDSVTYYGVSSFDSKKEQVRKIINILMDNGIIDRFEFNETRDNPYAQKVIRAVRQFITQVMSDKSNINESKIVDKIKSFLGKKPLTKDDKLINLIVKFIEENYPIDFTSDEDGDMTFYLTDNKGNFIIPAIMKYYPEFKRLEYKWDFTKDIYSWFSDDRLLHLDSEMMGKIFEKLFKKKVNRVNGYSRL